MTLAIKIGLHEALPLLEVQLEVAKTNASSVTFQKICRRCPRFRVEAASPPTCQCTLAKGLTCPFVRFCTLRKGRWLDQRFMRERITEKRSSVQTDSKLGSMTVQINRPQCRS